MNDREISLYGVMKKKEEVLEKKQDVMNSYMEVRYTGKPRFSYTEMKVYNTIFERLRNFDTLVKRNEKISSIEPYFRPECKNSHKCSLKFFVKCSKKLDFEKVNQEIMDEITSCRYIIVVSHLSFLRWRN